ncbi:hypothetical protein L1887_51718 [Cichorium endivia]|nr:hypothetical protein L1887_51718 [Cichorium endivia]
MDAMRQSELCRAPERREARSKPSYGGDQRHVNSTLEAGAGTRVKGSSEALGLGGSAVAHFGPQRAKESNTWQLPKHSHFDRAAAAVSTARAEPLSSRRPGCNHASFLFCTTTDHQSYTGLLGVATSPHRINTCRPSVLPPISVTFASNPEPSNILASVPHVHQPAFPTRSGPSPY